MTIEEINALIREVMAEQPNLSDPEDIATIVFERIPAKQRQDALAICLRLAVARVVGKDRQEAFQSNGKVRVVHRSPESLEHEASQTTRRGKERRDFIKSVIGRTTIRTEEDARLVEEASRARSQKVWDQFAGAMNEMAETFRLADLVRALDERVYVGGEWKFLRDCSVDEVRTLAEADAAKAHGMLERAGFYTALADEMERAGVDTAGQLRDRIEAAA